MTSRVYTETNEVISGEKGTPERIIKTTKQVVPGVEEESPQEYRTKKTIFRTYQVLFYVLGLIEILLAFRFVLRLIGASTVSEFTTFIYAMSAPFASPFFGIVPPISSGGSVLEWSTIIAMGVYAVVVWLIIELFQIVKPVDPKEVEESV